MVAAPILKLWPAKSFAGNLATVKADHTLPMNLVKRVQFYFTIGKVGLDHLSFLISKPGVQISDTGHPLSFQ